MDDQHVARPTEAPALRTALEAYGAARRALAERFACLSATPERYADLRADLEQAETTRVRAAALLGEVAWSVLGAAAEVSSGAAAYDAAHAPSETDIEVSAPPAPAATPDREPTADTPKSIDVEPLRRAWSGAADARRSSLDAERQRESDVARRVLDEVGPCLASFGDRALETEARRLLRFLDGKTATALVGVPASTARAAIEYVVARVRAAQTAAPARASTFDDVVRRAHVVREQAGRAVYCHGLSRGHDPRAATWAADAGELEAALRRVAGVCPADDASGRRDAVVAERSDDVPGATEIGGERAIIEATWPFWHVVRGKRVLMLGGTPVRDSREAIPRTFELASLLWIAADKPREVQRAAKQVANGSLDLVLVNKLVGHKATAPITRSASRSSVPVVVVRHGWGVTAIKAAIELAFAGAVAA